ncbi:MAG: right-handed parallel beta-helix repeat-containing protein [Nitrososphaerales archaeon]
MLVSAELRKRRLLVAVLITAFLPAVLALAAVGYQRPRPPQPPSYEPRPLPVLPTQVAIGARVLARSRRLSTLPPPGSSRLVGTASSHSLPTILLAPRVTPYRLRELQHRMPSAFGWAGKVLLLRASIEVPARTHLLIDASETPEVRLASSSKGFAAIIAEGGKIELRGTPRQILSISSWDERRQIHDTEPSDGRPFILVRRGWMNITWADVGFLGFGRGVTSGVAWRGDPGPARSGTGGTYAYGQVISSHLHDNWFGAYTFRARGMRWAYNTFSRNYAYGFDPHDLSSHFLVEHNLAYANGRHGFIFSRGCDHNVLRHNVAYDNRGHGFMIDDGRSESIRLARASVLASNYNQVTDNRAHDNDGTGIEIEGGTGNVVTSNVLERNRVGVRIKNRASTTVARNRIADNRLSGVALIGRVGDVGISNNRISGGWAGISLAGADRPRLDHNVVKAVTPFVVNGKSLRKQTTAERARLFFRWNPVLIVWTAILGVPALALLLRSATRSLATARTASQRGAINLVSIPGRGRVVRATCLLVATELLVGALMGLLFARKALDADPGHSTAYPLAAGNTRTTVGSSAARATTRRATGVLAGPACRDDVARFAQAVRDRIDPDGDALGGVGDAALVHLGHAALKQPGVLVSSRLAPSQRPGFIGAANQWLCY